MGLRVRDEMLRAKVLIFMIPLVLPIGQPPANATDRATPGAAECQVTFDAYGMEVERIAPPLAVPSKMSDEVR